MLPNTTGVELGQDFPPIKEDWYDLSLSAFEEKRDKNGDVYTKLECAIEGTKRKAWTNLGYGEKSLWKVKQFKVAIGASDTDGDLNLFINTRFKGYLKDEEYNGKHYPRIMEFKPFDSELPAKNEDDDLPF